MIYKRLLMPPKKAFFLFGPRGVGKSTWLKTSFPNAHLIDLLPTKIYWDYLKNPALLEQECLALPKETWIIIDEIQKIPALLDDVHHLIENLHYKNFILCGSSTRKLKRSGVNLLAGRAINRKLFPFTAQELNYKIDPIQAIYYGMLPGSILAETDADRKDFLKSYTEMYLKEEIKAEALTRNLDSFSRFLDIVAILNGQPINLSGISRDIGLSRNSVRTFFEILEDTLMGTWLESYRPRAKVKETNNAKFYLFDTGIAHALSTGFNQMPPSDWIGHALETWLYHELSADLHYRNPGGTLHYWRTPNGSEIDFIWTKDAQTIAIEVKASKQYQTHYSRHLLSFSESMPNTKKIVIYLGEKTLKDNTTDVYPVLTFLKELNNGNIY